MSPTPGRARQPGSGFCLMIPPYAGKDSVALHAFGGSAAFGASGAAGVDTSAEEAELENSNAAATTPEVVAPSARQMWAVIAVVVHKPNTISFPSHTPEFGGEAAVSGGKHQIEKIVICPKTLQIRPCSAASRQMLHFGNIKPDQVLLIGAYGIEHSL